MARSKMKESIEGNEEIISLPEERTKRAGSRKKEKKFIPASENDKLIITCTHFASNKEKTELLTGEGKEFDNDALLETLGFKKDDKGVLTLNTVDYQFDRDTKGNVIRLGDIKKEKESKDDGIDRAG